MSSGLRSRAHHEAGHAVMCLRLGRRIKTVSIVETEQHLGFCEAEPPKPPCTRQALAKDRFHSIAIALAGPISEAFYCGGYRPGSNSRAAFQAFEQGLLSLSGCETDLEALNFLPPAGKQRTRALSFVTDFLFGEFEILWPDIQRVARTLEKRRTMTGEEVLQILPAKSFVASCFSLLSRKELS